MLNELNASMIVPEADVMSHLQSALAEYDRGPSVIVIGVESRVMFCSPEQVAKTQTRNAANTKQSPRRGIRKQPGLTAEKEGRNPRERCNAAAS